MITHLLSSQVKQIWLREKLFNLILIKNQSRIMGNKNKSPHPSCSHFLTPCLRCSFLLKGWTLPAWGPSQILQCDSFTRAVVLHELLHSFPYSNTNTAQSVVWQDLDFYQGYNGCLLSSRKCCSPSTWRVVSAKEFNCIFLLTSPLEVNFLKPCESHSSTVLKRTTLNHTFNTLFFHEASEKLQTRST